MQKRANQPPSGGCVLKHGAGAQGDFPPRPAAFGRLCVETDDVAAKYRFENPAAFGRLCVETMLKSWILSTALPAAFGRLCVETVEKLLHNVAC